MAKQYITYTNTSKYYLAAYLKIKLISADGSQYSDGNQAFVYLKPGQSQRVWCQNLYDRPIAEVTPESAWIWYEYRPFSIASEKQTIAENKLPVKITNKSVFNSGNVVVTALLKKDGEIVWATETDIFDQPPYEQLRPGKSATLDLNLSNAPDFDDIEIQCGKSSGHQ